MVGLVFLLNWNKIYTIADITEDHADSTLSLEITRSCLCVLSLGCIFNRQKEGGGSRRYFGELRCEVVRSSQGGQGVNSIFCGITHSQHGLRHSLAEDAKVWDRRVLSHDRRSSLFCFTEDDGASDVYCVYFTCYFIFSASSYAEKWKLFQEWRSLWIWCKYICLYFHSFISYHAGTTACSLCRYVKLQFSVSYLFFRH